MKHRTEKSVFVGLLVVCLMLAADFSAQAQRTGGDLSPPSPGAAAAQPDTALKQPISNYEEIARRVDSLQFIIVYNAELLRKDLDTKLLWIYVMLGIMIIASMIIYGSLSAAQRQWKQLEERASARVSTAVSRLKSQLKSIKAAEKPTRSAPKRATRRRKKSR